MTAAVPAESAASVIAGIAAGSRSALARALTWLERDDLRAAEVSSAFATGSRPAHVIGVTGAPGAGKSTLIGALVDLPAYRDRSVAVLLLDPVSPVSGGALLADRLRIGRAAGETLFIRSIPARYDAQPALVHRVLIPALALLAAQGFDLVVLETVGAGQDPTPPLGLADTLVLLVTPAAADATQLRKRGVLELADLVVLNRADTAGTASARRQLATSLPALSGRPIVETVATTGSGVAELARMLVELERHPHAAGADARWRRARLLDPALVSAAESVFGLLATEVLATMRAGGDAADATPACLLRAVAERVLVAPAELRLGRAAPSSEEQGSSTTG